MSKHKLQLPDFHTLTWSEANYQVFHVISQLLYCCLQGTFVTILTLGMEKTHMPPCCSFQSPPTSAPVPCEAGYLRNAQLLLKRFGRGES